METIFGCSDMTVLARMVSHLSSDQLCMFMDALSSELFVKASDSALAYYYEDAENYKQASSHVSKAFYSLENIPS